MAQIGLLNDTARPDVGPHAAQYRQTTSTPSDSAVSDHGSVEGHSSVPHSMQSQQNQRQTPCHQCRLCHRTYERADHLNRHFRSHENARRFQCSQCTKRFNRADLLTRHVAAHERRENEKGSEERPLIRRTGRASSACLACVSSKTKCENQKPCQRCRDKGINCQQTPLPSKQAPYVAGESASTVAESVESSLSVTVVDGPGQPHHTQDLESGSALPQPSSSGRIDINSVYNGMIWAQTPAHLATDYPRPLPDTVLTSEALPLANSLPDDLIEDLIFFPNVSAFNQDLDFDFWDFPFDSFSQTALELEPITGGTLVEPVRSPLPCRNTARGYSAFKRSPWLWTPAPKDHSFSYHGDLALDEEQITSNFTTPSAVTGNDLPTGKIYIDAAARDRMLALVVSTNKIARPIPSFPSLEILNRIIHIFFVSGSYQIDNWIHAATFDATESPPQLLISLVSAGTTLISIPAVWKMGLALQELTRITIAENWERNNSATRDLALTCAFALCLDIGLWSGFKRKMEIAEGFSQAIVTVLCRAGYFAAAQESAAMNPTVEDTGDLLDAKWRKWVKRESIKRLVLHLFMHVTRASISFQNSPLIQLSDLEFPLPESRDLWHARSAIEWKSKYLRKRPLAMNLGLRLMDIIHDVTLLDIIQDHVDIELCVTVSLYGFWGQIWSFRESMKFYHGAGNSSPRLWLEAQKSDLCRDIESFAGQLSKIGRVSADIIIMKELFLMVLNASLDELQRFAGRGGEEEARRAATNLQSWVTSIDARKAAWHAGQVFQAARAFPPAELRGFYAIAVYFASLTLWVYASLPSALVAEMGQVKAYPHGQEDRSFNVVLDGLETRETRAFLSVSQGKPGLSDRTSGNESSFLSLDDPNVVFRSARDIYRRNFPDLEEPLPPLVENLGNLMRDLGSLPES